MARLLDSIPSSPNAIDYFIGIDGIFKYTKEKNPNLPDLSPDIERGMVIFAGSEVKKFVSILVDKPNTTEFNKRNAYLEACEKLGDIDVLIIVDSDEYFFYELGTIDPKECWMRFRKNLEFEIRKYPHHNVFGINYIDEAGTKTYKPRIWVRPHEMRYIYGSHYHYANIEREKDDIELFKKNRICYTQQAQAIVKGLTLAHDNHSLRSEDYQQRREEYQKYLVKYEELIQSHKHTEEEAHKLAKQSPKTDFNPT